MVVTVQEKDYPKLLKDLENDDRGPYQAIKLLRNFERGRISSLEISVDVFPAPNIVIIKPTDLNANLLHMKNVVVFTRNNAEFDDTFLSSGVINPKSDYFIVATHGTNSRPINDYLIRAGAAQVKPTTIGCFTLCKEDLILFPPPAGMSIKPVSHDLVPTIHTNWPYSMETTIDYIHYLVDNYPSVAMFDVDDSLIGYMLETHDGGVGMLRVVPEKRGKGYSKVILSHLCKQILEREELCISSILPNNQVSISLHVKVGFKESEQFEGWIHCFSSKQSTE